MFLFYFILFTQPKPHSPFSSPSLLEIALSIGREKGRLVTFDPIPKAQVLRRISEYMDKMSVEYCEEYYDCLSEHSTRVREEREGIEKIREGEKGEKEGGRGRKKVNVVYENDLEWVLGREVRGFDRFVKTNQHILVSPSLNYFTIFELERLLRWFVVCCGGAGGGGGLSMKELGACFGMAMRVCSFFFPFFFFPHTKTFR